MAGKLCRIGKDAWSVDIDHLAPWIEIIAVTTGSRRTCFIDGGVGFDYVAAYFKAIASHGTEVAVVDYQNSILVVLDAKSVNDDRIKLKFKRELPMDFYPTICAAYRSDLWIVGNIADLLLVGRDENVRTLPRPELLGGFIDSIAIVNEDIFAHSKGSSNVARYNFNSGSWTYERPNGNVEKIVMLVASSDRMAYVIEEDCGKLLRMYGVDKVVDLDLKGVLTGIVLDDDEIFYQTNDQGNRMTCRVSMP